MGIVGSDPERPENGVGLIGFAYGRDPVPHVPPRFFGFTSTQAKLFHIITWETPRPTGSTLYYSALSEEHVDFSGTVYFQKLYLNSATSFNGDKSFAAQSLSYRVSDHMGYFVIQGAHGCGFNLADK